MICAYCKQQIRNKVLHYNDLDFCDWDCLGDFLLDQIADVVQEEVIPYYTEQEKKYWAEMEAGEEKAAIERDLRGWD